VHLTSKQARFWNRVSHSKTDGDTQQYLRAKHLDVNEAYNGDAFTASPWSHRRRKSAVRNQQPLIADLSCGCELIG